MNYLSSGYYETKIKSLKDAILRTQKELSESGENKITNNRLECLKNRLSDAENSYTKYKNKNPQREVYY
jgi:ribosome-interacting GTPase 1